MTSHVPDPEICWRIDFVPPSEGTECLSLLRGDLAAAPLRDFHPKTLTAVMLLHVARLFRLLVILFYVWLCFQFQATVLLPYCMLCHIDVQVIFMLVRFLCLLSLSMLVPSFVKLSMALKSVAFCGCLLHVFFFDTGLSSSFQNVSVAGLNLCVWCCWCCWCHRPVVFVTVDRVFIFVGDRHGTSQADSSLQCWTIVKDED